VPRDARLRSARLLGAGQLGRKALSRAACNQGRYEMPVIETRHLDQGELTKIVRGRDDGSDAITAAELPF
jgi:hypothetical protein